MCIKLRCTCGGSGLYIGLCIGAVGMCTSAEDPKVISGSADLQPGACVLGLRKIFQFDFEWRAMRTWQHANREGKGWLRNQQQMRRQRSWQVTSEQDRVHCLLPSRTRSSGSTGTNKQAA